MELNQVRRGQGSPLVLVHGIGDSLRTWSLVAERLERHHTVIAVDLPGFGASPPLEGAPTVPALADAVAEVTGGEPFHVAGNSLGGGIALQLALTGRALSATALSPVGFQAGWETAYSRASLVATRALGRLLAPVAEPLTRPPAGRIAVFAQMLAHPTRIPPADAAAALRSVAECPGFEATLAAGVSWECAAVTELPVPVTVAWGTKDRLLLHGPQHRRARERLPGALHVGLAGCGHLPQWDAPGVVARVVLETAARR
jgi:pimeloyl-ACP methyl ester carboxylesterase